MTRTAIHRLQDDLAAKVEALEALAARASVLQRWMEEIGRAVTVADVGRLAAGYGRELFGAEGTLMFLVDATGEFLELVSFGGVNSERVEPWRRMAITSDYPMSMAVRTGEPLWYSSRDAVIAAWPPLAEVSHDGALLQGLVAVPIAGSQGVIGGLAFSFYEPPALDNVVVDFYRTVAAQCGVAIERTRAREAEQSALAVASAANQQLTEQRQRLAQLADASRMLTSSLDSRTAMAQLVRAFVPSFGDWCALHELGDDGLPHQLVLHHRNPKKVALAERLNAEYPVPPREDSGVLKVMRTGETEWVQEIPKEAIRASAVNAEHLALLEAIELGSYAILPVRARGRILGVLTLVTEGTRRFSADDIQFAEDLASRSGLALDNARLFESAEGARVHLHNLLMRVPAAIAIMRGPEFVFELLNEEGCRLIGRSDVLGEPITAIANSLESPLARTLREVYASGEPHFETESQIASPAGEERMFNMVYQPDRDASGAVTGVVMFAFEVTPQVQARRRVEALVADVARAEASARAHAETLASLNELAHVTAAELDPTKVVQAVSDTVTRLTGAEFGVFFYEAPDRADILRGTSGRTLPVFKRMLSIKEPLVSRTFLSGHIVRRDDDETRHRQRPESYLGVPVVSRNGDVMGAICIAHREPGRFGAPAEALAIRIAEKAALALDNARLHAASQRLIRNLETSNRELDQFAYVASHDLKAPLRGIGSLAEWIEEDLAPVMTPDARHKLDLLRRRVHRMEGLIQGVLDFSRVGRTTGRPEEISVPKLLADIVDLLAPTPEQSIVFGSDLPVVVAEHVSLQQVFMNLISNGLKHADRPDARVEITARELPEEWEFRVADNGPGIAPEFHSRIWGIFQTLQARDKVESTGIGLAIVKKIVDAHGGREWIEATPGGGATFCFTWPNPRRTHERTPRRQ